MSRVRSPNYPSISLPEALQRIRQIHAAERHLSAPKEVIAKHLGYGGLNGASIKIISALGKYGLLEEVGSDKLRVSPLGVSILYPKDETEKQAAIRTAAYSPPLFMEIAQEWEGGDPSDQNLRSYLVRRNFADDAVDRVIQSYRETMALVTPESPAYDSGSPAQPEAREERFERMLNTPANEIKLPPNAVFEEPLLDPFEVSISGNRTSKKLEGRFSLRDQGDLDELVSVLTAMRGQLPAPKTVDLSDDENRDLKG